MAANGVRWEGVAQFKLEQLPKKDRRGFEKAVAALAGLPPERWPPRKVIPLGAEEGEEELYLVLAPNGWRAGVSPTEDNGILVRNLIHKRTIEALQRTSKPEGD